MSAALPPREYFTLLSAARRLDTNPIALRARCRRAQRPDGSAHLGGGIVAFKFGSTWRVWFPT